MAIKSGDFSLVRIGTFGVDVVALSGADLRLSPDCRTMITEIVWLMLAIALMIKVHTTCRCGRCRMVGVATFVFQKHELCLIYNGS